MFKVGEILVDIYQLEQQLGRTATGHQTWLALDLRSQEKVTLKLLAFSPQIHWEEVKLFEREAQVLKSLEHSQIPRYREYFEIDKNKGYGIAWFALVQDYIPGLSLQELLEKGRRFTEVEIRAIAQQILEILIYLHELHPYVLHRDIKPSNLILGEDNHIYLIDFGAVQAQGAVTGVTFTIVGSSGYAPLEQFWGRAVPASDVYALGATLIHLLTGISPTDLPQKDSRIQFADRVNLPPDLIYWLEKATDISLENRFKSAREALEFLQSKRRSPSFSNRSFLRNKLIQPSYSRVVLMKTSERLTLDFPAKLNIKANNLIIILISFIISLLTLAIFPLSLAILALVYWSLKTTHASLSAEHLKIQRKILGFTYQSIDCRSREIIGVFLHSDRHNYQIKIRTETQVYLLGEYLKEYECAWLAQEIQDWLYRDYK